MIINEMPGGISLNPTTAAAAQILNGYTAYNGSGDFLTGSMLNTVTTANASCIMNGYTAYNNLGNLIIGNKDMDISGTETLTYVVSDVLNPSHTINIGVFPNLIINTEATTSYIKLLDATGANRGNFVVNIPALKITLTPGISYNWDSQVYSSGANIYVFRLRFEYNTEGVLSIIFTGGNSITPNCAIRTFDTVLTVAYTGTQIQPGRQVFVGTLSATGSVTGITLSGIGFQPTDFIVSAYLSRSDTQQNIVLGSGAYLTSMGVINGSKIFSVASAVSNNLYLYKINGNNYFNYSVGNGTISLSKDGGTNIYIPYYDNYIYWFVIAAA